MDQYFKVFWINIMSSASIFMNSYTNNFSYTYLLITDDVIHEHEWRPQSSNELFICLDSLMTTFSSLKITNEYQLML